MSPDASNSDACDRAVAVLEAVASTIGSRHSGDVADALVNALMLIAIAQPAPRAALADAARLLTEAIENMPTFLRRDQ